MDAKQVWRAALGELQVSLSPANYETWLKDTALVGVEGDRFRVAVPNGFAKDWLENRYRSLIAQTLARVVGYSVNVEFEVRERRSPRSEPMPAPTATARRAPPRARRARARRWRGRRRQPQPALHVPDLHRRLRQPAGPCREPVGRRAPGSRPTTRSSCTAAWASGKTHLMHAIGNAVVARFPRKRVVYATSEKFTNEFITGIQQGRIDDFRARYRRIDLLLIDDIQFIADKERTQEEFFHTFNAIHEDGKQIVLSSDRPPKQIATLEERLRSRFEWGLIADLTAPDLETRIAILRAKAEEQGVRVGPEALEFIARKVASNIRELEGALNRIVAYASMQGMPITADLAQAVLSNVLYSPRKRAVTPERIAIAVSEYYGVDIEALRGQKRDRAIVVPRQIAMYLMRARDRRLAAAHRRRAGRPRPLDRPPRLRQDRPRDREQRGAAPRAGGRPGAHLLRALASRPRPVATRARRPRPVGTYPAVDERPATRRRCRGACGRRWSSAGARTARDRGESWTPAADRPT